MSRHPELCLTPASLDACLRRDVCACVCACVGVWSSARALHLKAPADQTWGRQGEGRATFQHHQLYEVSARAKTTQQTSGPPNRQATTPSRRFHHSGGRKKGRAIKQESERERERVREGEAEMEEVCGERNNRVRHGSLATTWWPPPRRPPRKQQQSFPNKQATTIKAPTFLKGPRRQFLAAGKTAGEGRGGKRWRAGNAAIAQRGSICICQRVRRHAPPHHSREKPPAAAAAATADGEPFAQRQRRQREGGA